MRQVITNFLSNALKYTPAGKQVFIELSTQEDTAVLCIRDEGIGIPAADLENLFEPFHRAANVGTISGTGLGLAIAWRMVKMHGGHITVCSEVDAGSTFCVYLPMTKRDSNEKDSSD